MFCKLVSAPERLPVSLAEVKAHLNISHSYDDTLIRAMLSSAVTAAESETARKFVTQTWNYFLNGFPGADRIFLPWGNLQSVGGVYYTNIYGFETAFDASFYQVVTETDDAGLIALHEGAEWPDADLWPVNPVRIRLTCGWHIGDSWLAGTAASLGGIVVPTVANGLAYQCTAAGVTGAVEPSWPTATGNAVSDGSAAWVCPGATVPEAIRAAVKIMTADLYQSRESTFDIQRYRTQAVEALLTPFRIWRQFP